MTQSSRSVCNILSPFVVNARRIITHMPTPNSAAELSDLFRKLGATDPEQWAASQTDEGIPQLHRYLFLREAWQRIIAEDDVNWIEAYIRVSENNPNESYAGIGLALRRCLDNGAAVEDLTEIVRGMQAQLLFSFTYMLEDPDIRDPDVRDLCWALFAVDDDGHPLTHIGGLHESVLETDPTGREMRPKAKDRQ
jgi:hypothetical protein